MSGTLCIGPMCKSGGIMYAMCIVYSCKLVDDTKQLYSYLYYYYKHNSPKKVSHQPWKSQKAPSSIEELWVWEGQQKCKTFRAKYRLDKQWSINHVGNTLLTSTFKNFVHFGSLSIGNFLN